MRADGGCHGGSVSGGLSCLRAATAAPNGQLPLSGQKAGEAVMPLRDIVVHLDQTPRTAARLETAVNLAAAHGAHLNGLYLVSYPEIPGYVRVQLSDDILRHQVAAVRDAATVTEALFREQVRHAGLNAEWRQVEGTVVPALARHARAADCAIVGQHDPGDDGGDDPETPDRVVLSAGRPVLVIPSAGRFPAVGRRVLVAWDGSRLAARAVNDALPFLTAARSVIVLSVNPKAGGPKSDALPAADLCSHLSRHGIAAEERTLFADDISVGDLLLSRAAEEGIDLIVTGAYGHARWREIVLGGVTRHMLQHMTVPVLMSH
jgi:nucleotide-binding universal stress UspA family protein